MNENSKTIMFIIVAAAAALIAWVSQPHEYVGAPNKVVGEKLIADFDPLSAASLEIVQYDESTATLHPFQVALVELNGKRRWSIPSHENYPADADRQVAGAATALMGLKILSLEGDTQADQEKFGVIDPDPKTLKAGMTGVGLKVTIRDKSGKDLASLVIGKEVPDRPGLRYVRRPGQDPIYVAAVKTDNFSTKFDNWIEKNLLKLNPWDLHQLWLRNYSTALMMDEQGRIGVEKQNRGEMLLQYADQTEPHWKLIEDRMVNEDGTYTPNKLADDEELDVAKLDQMKNALNDLKIVDVTRKPDGLSADLKAAADFTSRKESLLTLATRGFIVARAGDQVEVCSKEGEVRCLMNDGVEYVLRFGDVAAESGAEGKTEEKDKDQIDEAGKDQKKTAGLNRYLFVMAEFNADAIPQPQLEPLPEEKPAAAEVKDAAKAEEKTTEAKEPPVAEKIDKGANAEQEAEKKQSALQADRQLVEKENKRKQDEYEEKIAAGKKHAEELNARFADWYYIISDEVYRKIHLSREEIIKKKEKKDAQNGGKPGDEIMPPGGPVSDFNNLLEKGPGEK